MSHHRRVSAASWRHKAPSALVLAALLAALGGCTDDVSAPTEASHSLLQPAVTRVNQDSIQEVRQSALAVITRATAMALQDNGLRQRLNQDLRGSRHTPEHKIEFNRYIHGNGGILLAKMSEHANISRDSLVVLLNAFDRSLEFYVPVDEHRARWIGSSDLLVAGQLRDKSEIIGYSLDGSRVTLDASRPSSTPTIAIVPTETDFSQGLSADWVNADDAGGRAIGTYQAPDARASSQPRLQYTGTDSKTSASAALIPPDPCWENPYLPECIVPPTEYPAGLFITRSNIPDLGESWLRGDPEIDVFIVGASFSGWSGPIMSCSGNGYGGAPAPVDSRKWFDQNNSSWERNPSAAVHGMLFSQTDITNYRLWYTADYALTIQVWEDDDGACAIRGNNTSDLQELYNDLRGAYGVASAIINVTTVSSTETLFSWAASVANAFNTMVVGDDQLLGTTMPTGLVGQSYPDATHILYREQGTGSLQENGRVYLQLTSP